VIEEPGCPDWKHRPQARQAAVIEENQHGLDAPIDRVVGGHSQFDGL
jgi:hypothetical protein